MLYVLKTFLMNKWRVKPQNRKEKRSTKLSQEVLRSIYISVKQGTSVCIWKRENVQGEGSKGFQKPRCLSYIILRYPLLFLKYNYLLGKWPFFSNYELQLRIELHLNFTFESKINKLFSIGYSLLFPPITVLILPKYQ